MTTSVLYIVTHETEVKWEGARASHHYFVNLEAAQIKYNEIATEIGAEDAISDEREAVILEKFTLDGFEYRPSRARYYQRKERCGIAYYG